MPHLSNALKLFCSNPNPGFDTHATGCGMAGTAGTVQIAHIEPDNALDPSRFGRLQDLKLWARARRKGKRRPGFSPSALVKRAWRCH